MAAERFRVAVRQRWGDRALEQEWPFATCDAARVAAAADEAGASLEYTSHFLGAVITPSAARRMKLNVPPPLRLARDGDAWLVEADTFVIDGRVDPAIARTTKILERATEGVTSGVFASEDHAREAMRREFGVQE